MAREMLGLWDVTIMGLGIVTTSLGNERQVGNYLLGWGNHVRWDPQVLLQRTRRDKEETKVPLIGEQREYIQWFSW